jgi:hypothetical protein
MNRNHITDVAFIIGWIILLAILVYKIAESQRAEASAKLFQPAYASVQETKRPQTTAVPQRTGTPQTTAPGYVLSMELKQPLSVRDTERPEELQVQ